MNFENLILIGIDSAYWAYSRYTRKVIYLFLYHLITRRKFTLHGSLTLFKFFAYLKIVLNSNIPGLMHYLIYGHKENRNPHPLFDEKFYKEENKDLENSNIPGLMHYLIYGYKENRNPHPLIKVDYLEI